MYSQVSSIYCSPLEHANGLVNVQRPENDDAEATEESKSAADDACRPIASKPVLKQHLLKTPAPGASLTMRCIDAVQTRCISSSVSPIFRLADTAPAASAHMC